MTSTIEKWRDPVDQDPPEHDEPECICADPKEPTPDCFHHGTDSANERAPQRTKAMRFESERAHAHAMLDGLLEDAEDCWYDTKAWRLIDKYVFDNIVAPAREIQGERQDQVKANDQ